MTIYEELIQEVERGSRFYIDLKFRTMKINGKYLIQKGEYNNERKLMNYPEDCITNILKRIEELYEQYRFSIPSERSDTKRKKYFVALSADELTDEQLICGESREVAQAALEGYILCCILNGTFKWEAETMGTWFWQSELYEELILLKDWVEQPV